LPQKASKRQQKKKPLNRQKEASAHSLRRAHGQRSDCSSGVLGHACRSDELHAEHAAALVSHRIRCAFDAIAWNNTTTKWTGVPCFIGVPGAIKQRRYCARCKYRLTPQGTDGRSNRQRFTDEQKRAMVQEKEKPGVAGGGCLPPHGMAASQLFRWRVQFGLTACKTPQLATVILADGVVNQVPALSTLRDLAGPLDGMTLS
jgi:transposase-like protein